MHEVRIERPLRLFAPAKINLGLEVLRRRDDGYHDLLTIMQSVSLFDQIILTPSDQFAFRGDPRIDRQSDLAFRAAEMFQQQTGIDIRARIRVQKRIPLSGGLGGGSSDAGTLLRALCDLASIPNSTAHDMAADLGSDVPFFLHGGTALASGTGTRIEPLPNIPRTWLVLVTPPSQTDNKTASRYAQLTPDDFSDGETVVRTASAIRRGDRIDWASLPNAFERAALSDVTAASAKAGLLAAGAPFVLPCGSGPSLFTVVETWQEARALAGRLSSDGQTAIASTTIGPNLNAERVARSLD